MSVTPDENTLPPTPEPPAPKAPTPKPPPHWLRQSLRELLVLIIGILLSVWITNLVQNGKDDDRAAGYLVRIQSDLADDMVKLRDDYDRRKSQRAAAQKMLGALNSTDSSEVFGVVFQGFQELLWTTRFSPKDATFRSLESTGDLRLIRNDSIVTGLMDVYAYSYESVNDNNVDITKYRDNFLLPYVTENLKFRQAFNPMAYGIPTIPNRDQLYNHLIYLDISLGSTVSAYARSVNQVAALQRLIAREQAR